MPKIINEIKYYDCGYCTNDLKLVFRHHKKEKVRFPAGVFLIKHPEAGYILYDTGYSEKIYDLGWKGKLYNLINPTVIKHEDRIDVRLSKDGIDCGEIKYLILSHLHPDHIGCVGSFKNARIILSAEAFDSYKNNKLLYLIFDKLLPDDFEKRLMLMSDEMLMKEKNKYFSYHDLFGDGSILLTKINGHANGQLCCMIEDSLFLGADSSWGNGFVGKADEFRFFPRLIQADMKAYIEGDRLLRKMADDGIRLAFSHDTYSESIIKI